VSNPAIALQEAMHAALLASAPLAALLQGQHVYEEKPRGAQTSFVAFDEIETSDWSVKDQKAHEHFVTLSVQTNSRSRKLAQEIVAAIEAALDGARLTLAGHALVSLRMVFWTVMRARNSETFAATLRFRAATEPF
jgi:hypothetical protein